MTGKSSALQGLRDRAQDVVISVNLAAFGQLVSRFNQSTSRA